GITGAFVYDASNHPVFAFVNGEPVKIDPIGEAKASLEKLIAAARANPGEESVPQASVVMFQGRPQLASAAMISYAEYRARWQNGHVPFVLVFLRAVDADYLSSIAKDYGLTGLGWAEKVDQAEAATLPLVAVDGAPMGQLYWMPDRPGRSLALHILPWA